jgi:hypothetical protein
MKRLLCGAALLAACAGLAAAEPPAPAPGPPDDVEILVDGGVDVAKKELAERGELAPFAYFVTLDGRVQRLTPKQGVKLPPSEAMLELLQALFRERAAAGECRAVAVFADVVIGLPGGRQSDALQVGVEHRSGFCANYFYPYRRDADGTLRFEPPVTGPRQGVVFDTCP